MIGIHDTGIAMHSREFAEVTLTEKGHRGLEVGAKALAMAGVEILTRPGLLTEVKDAFERTEK